LRNVQNEVIRFVKNVKIAYCARYFDLLCNSPSTVSAYADEGELLVLTAFLTSGSLSKTTSFPRQCA